MRCHSAYGSIKSLRLPKRADRRSRGFAFVEFATKKECEYAMKVLQNTHLLGRHLKFETVKEDQLEDFLA
jgi:multiple RNA-binding domain-containing protein 1